MTKEMSGQKTGAGGSRTTEPDHAELSTGGGGGVLARVVS